MTTIEATRDHELTLVGASKTALGFRGFSDACLKFSKELGMEVIAYKGAFETTESGTMYWNDGSEDNFSYCEFRCGGFMMHDTGDLYHLSIPFLTWSNGVSK